MAEEIQNKVVMRTTSRREHTNRRIDVERREKTSMVTFNKRDQQRRSSTRRTTNSRREV